MTTLRFRLRTWLGWGGHPEELRTLGEMRLRHATFTAFFILLSLIALVGLPGRGSHGFNSVNFSLALQRTLPFDFVISLAVFAYLGAPAIGNLLLARRVASDVLRTTQGRCFEVRLAPSIYLFAQIGPTLENARWYPLPIEWDAVVMPSEDTYEVEYLPTAGWVHRVRRFGASSRELVQPAPSEVNNEEQATEEQKKQQKQPSAEEQRELRRYTRRVWQCWGEPAVSIAACGWTGVLSGIIFAPGMLVLAYWYVATYPELARKSDAVAGIVFLATFFAIGCGCIIWGVWSFRLWGRVRRAAEEGAQSVEGDVVSWLPYRQGRETIVKVRADDGTAKILRVRRLFTNRVRRVGGRVRIEYMPISEYVTTVSYADTPTWVG